MEKLSDFKPLKRVVLPSLGELDCSGLTVIVGPNSSGKTQFLRDIHKKVAGEPRDLVVAEKIELDLPEYEPFIKCLKQEGYMRSVFDDNDQEQYISMTPALGSGQAAQNIPSTQAAQIFSRSKQQSERQRKIEWLAYNAQFLVTALFLENRLNALNSVGNIHYTQAPPQRDLHALHLNEEAKDALNKEAVRAFSRSIWSDISQGDSLCLRVGFDSKTPSPEYRLSAQKMSEYRTIMDEGDGMKSYLATCISILLGRRPVCVIDEPEMCLHPPQAYNLGQFIGKHATSTQTATFVATHSSQVLRGVIETANKLKIVRLSKTDSGFHATQVDSDILAETMKKPTIRAETVLDGIFSQAVAIIEGDGDRLVYQATWERVGSELNFDIHFASVGGTGGIADTCKLYRVLGIPVSVIADLDLITDKEKIKSILTVLCDDSSNVLKLISKVDSIAKELRELPPSLSEEEAVNKLKDLAAEEYDWDKGNDKELRSKLNSLSNNLNGMRNVKNGGLRELPEKITTPLKSLLSDLENHGLFLAPFGELEDWLEGCGISASKTKNKWAWANEAANYIRNNEPQKDDIWGFVTRLGKYLASKLQ